MIPQDTASTPAEGLAPKGDRSPAIGTYDKDDCVWWTDIHGHERTATVLRVLADGIEIRVADVGATVHVHPRELSPR